MARMSLLMSSAYVWDVSGQLILGFALALRIASTSAVPAFGNANYGSSGVMRWYCATAQKSVSCSGKGYPFVGGEDIPWTSCG
ncbi:hypothetical protein CERSUDRAFT_82224 [Gelatoporia subvermispora B]|uniref:Uncharacterized protein n=1 Tax=Ceriporiopsis subvermispora (strain B) TaxID=914234 RepID=M2RGU7_CERS8|nr:hypothetical protein CERSUDRAFT_82224 [Gelatoporia subvermispora B]